MTGFSSGRWALVAAVCAAGLASGASAQEAAGGIGEDGKAMAPTGDATPVQALVVTSQRQAALANKVIEKSSSEKVKTYAKGVAQSCEVRLKSLQYVGGKGIEVRPGKADEDSAAAQGYLAEDAKDVDPAPGRYNPPGSRDVGPGMKDPKPGGADLKEPVKPKPRSRVGVPGLEQAPREGAGGGGDQAAAESDPKAMLQAARKQLVADLKTLDTASDVDAAYLEMQREELMSAVKTFKESTPGPGLRGIMRTAMKTFRKDLLAAAKLAKKD